MAALTRRRRRSRVIAGLLLGLALVGGAVVLGGPNAGADASPRGTDMIRSWPTGLCIAGNDPAGGDVLGTVSAGDCDFSEAQQWSEAGVLRSPTEASELIGGAFFTRLVNVRTGLCLDSNAVGDVYALPCERDNRYQEWSRHWPIRGAVPDAVRDLVAVYSSQATGRCLSIGADHVLRTMPCGNPQALPGVTAWTDDMFFRRGY
jgi:hypothetical protein